MRNAKNGHHKPCHKPRNLPEVQTLNDAHPRYVIPLNENSASYIQEHRNIRSTNIERSSNTSEEKHVYNSRSRTNVLHLPSLHPPSYSAHLACHILWMSTREQTTTTKQTKRQHDTLRQDGQGGTCFERDTDQVDLETLRRSTRAQGPEQYQAAANTPRFQPLHELRRQPWCHTTWENRQCDDSQSYTPPNYPQRHKTNT